MFSIVDGFGWRFCTGAQPFEGTFWRLWVRAVLNEPGLGVVSNGKGINGGAVRKGNTALPNNKPVRAWLAQAVAIFKQETSPFGAARPLLYMVRAATTFGPAARARALSQLRVCNAESARECLPSDRSSPAGRLSALSQCF